MGTRKYSKYTKRFGSEMTQLIDTLKAEKAKKEKAILISYCLSTLIHASGCVDVNCQLHSCRKLKRIAYHTRSCKLKITGGCFNCLNLVALCYLHAKECQDRNCSVPFCEMINQKILVRAKKR